MPFLSAFTPCGMLRFSSADSAAKKAYNTLASLQGGAFSLTQGTDAEAKTYATAMLLGRAAQALERAKNQRDPLQANELLPVLEQNFDGVPLTTQTLDQRRQAQATRMKRPAGGRRTDIEQALVAALGADFIAYRPTSNTEASVVPTDPTTGGIFSRPDIAPKRYQLTAPITQIGTSIAYVAALFGSAPLAQGDSIVMDCGNRSQREVIPIIKVGSPTAFLATFTKSHDVGAICTTGPFPAWSSTKRESIIVLSDAAVVDPVRRNKAHAVMRKYARGVSTWNLCGVTGMSTGFIIGQTPIGTSPLVATTY